MHREFVLGLQSLYRLVLDNVRIFDYIISYQRYVVVGVALMNEHDHVEDSEFRCNSPWGLIHFSLCRKPRPPSCKNFRGNLVLVVGRVGGAAAGQKGKAGWLW